MVGLPQPTSRGQAVFVTLDEEEFAKILRDSGWGEDAIDGEIKVLQEYKTRFKLGDRQIKTIEIDDSSPLSRAVQRKKLKKREEDA